MLSRIVVKFYLVCIHGTLQNECTVTVVCDHYGVVFVVLGSTRTTALRCVVWCLRFLMNSYFFPSRRPYDQVNHSIGRVNTEKKTVQRRGTVDLVDDTGSHQRHLTMAGRLAKTCGTLTTCHRHFLIEAHAPS